MVPRIEYRAQEMLVGIIIFVSFYLFNGGGGCFFIWQANDKYILSNFSVSGTVLGMENTSVTKVWSPFSTVSV